MSFNFGQQTAESNLAPSNVTPYAIWYNGNGRDYRNSKLHPLLRYGGFMVPVEVVGENFPIGDINEHVFSGDKVADMYYIGTSQVLFTGKRENWFIGDKKNPTWLKPGEFMPKGSKGGKRVQYQFVFQGAEQWHYENGSLQVTFWGISGMKVEDAFKSFTGLLKQGARLVGASTLNATTFYWDIVPGKPEKSSKTIADARDITPPKHNLAGYPKDGTDQAIGEFLTTLVPTPENKAIADAIFSVNKEWSETMPFSGDGYEGNTEEITEPPDYDSDMVESMGITLPE